MVYSEDKKYKIKYGKDMFRINSGFTGWHALYLLVPVFIAVLIPCMYLSAQSSLSVIDVDTDDIPVVAKVESVAPVDTAENLTGPATALKNKILFVGDSITRGMTNCDYATAQCDQVDKSAVSNEIEVLGTEEFAAKLEDSQAQTTADHIASGIKNDGADIAQIMLGTNDAGKGVSSAEYKRNMQIIIKSLINSGARKVVVNKPIYSTPVAEKINEYWAALQEVPSIFDGVQVIKGDEEAYEWFAQRTYLLDGDGGGFHPDEYGYEILGQFWAKALRKVVAEDTKTAV